MANGVVQGPRITTMPISFFSVGDTISTVLSKTMFMNWS